MRMFKTYILENPKQRLYIGYTNDVDGRLMRHNMGAVKSTKGRGPWRIIYTKEFTTKVEASTYERYLKTLKSPKYIREYILKK